jgi:hypothetical protein
MEAWVMDCELGVVTPTLIEWPVAVAVASYRQVKFWWKWYCGLEHAE